MIMEFFDGVKVDKVVDGIVVLNSHDVVLSLFGADWFKVSSETVFSVVGDFIKKHDAICSEEERYSSAFWGGVREARELGKKVVVYEVI